MSLNVRSISNKINEIANFLFNPYGEKLLDCLALQEIWNVPAGVEFSIEGFHPLIYKTRDSIGLSANAGGGGVFLSTKNVNLKFWKNCQFLFHEFLRVSLSKYI